MDPWLPYEPDSRRPWNSKRAAHLLRRAGFGGTKGDLELAVERGVHDTIDWLLATPASEDSFDRTLRRSVGELAIQDQVESLQGAWVDRMVRTPYPLVEKMTLFWHDHFATSLEKVVDPRLMADQNDTFRRLALAPFEEMLRAVSRDPAMIEWLDNQTNRKEAPNENYARELLELFSMGVGHYTETDIREIARAFTGWHREGRRFQFRNELADPGSKSFFGRTGRFGGDEAIGIILEQPAAAEFLARKLLAFFVRPDPPKEWVLPLADHLRASDFSIASAVERILRSSLFFSDQAYRSIVKCPVEFAVGAVQALGVKFPPAALARSMTAMGQNLYHPPNVAGWEGGRAWVSATTILARAEFARRLSEANGGDLGTLFDPRSIGLPIEEGPLAVADALLDRLLPGEAPAEIRPRLVEYATGSPDGASQSRREWARHADQKTRGLVHLILSLPEYSLA